MKILSWNCRGLAIPKQFLLYVSWFELARQMLFFLLETLAYVNKLEELRWKLGYECCFAVDREDRSGGLGFFLEGFYELLYYFLF